ncbi:MAG: aminotransferase class IV [Planctomycetaceae bacterium]|nr:aminotransferase class IV [Planctomycetaceae bacterium]
MNPQVAWHNGSIVPYDTLSLPVSELAVVAGASITEMARTFGHKPFRLPEHVGRLLDSCTELGFSQPFSPSELVSAAKQIAAANAAALPPRDDLGIVMFVTAGTNATYFGVGDLPGPNVIIHTFRLPLELWKTAATAGVKLTIPQRRQLPDHSFPVHRKVRNRLHWWLADKEAAAISPGSRALLLDEHDHITETSNGCFFGIAEGAIVTPSAGVLDSMSRRIVEQAAAQLGCPLHRRPIHREEVQQLTAAFVTSTPFGVLPVTGIDDHVLAASDFVEQLADYWQQLTGCNPLQQLRECV